MITDRPIGIVVKPVLIGPVDWEEKICKVSANQNKERPIAAKLFAT